ncbi:putative rxt2-like protein [Erysiphe neolycopersici]|uniref:Putative rxt2-like protein n=1 Tax=Erysiphe neolycopersici TaxID=212602 RepID=A0A420H992_9PEZI|nr:putative rxt2-like protein [Erysiphe neolycopersici]
MLPGIISQSVLETLDYASMTSQQAIFADTINCMKKAIKRKAYESDSDNSIDKYTNRGNKLRKKARFVREGQLAPPTGPQIYRRTIEHSGFFRDILSRNPPLIDEDGYEIDSDDDEERTQTALAVAAQLNPYAQVKLEHLLAPLTAASELPNHPSLSKPFTSRTLTNLTLEARDMVQKERKCLWKLKHLMTIMSGDNNWIPCHIVEGDDDWALFFDEQYNNQNNTPKIDESNEVNCEASAGEILTGTQKHSPDAIIAAVKHLIAKEQQEKNETFHRTSSKAELDVPQTISMEDQVEAVVSSSTNKENKPDKTAIPVDENSKSIKEAGSVDTNDDKDHVSIPHRMQTRAQTHAHLEDPAVKLRPSPSESASISFIHPYFLSPSKSRPDRNFGLPQNEAIETRRVLQLYIQKQEEVCRGIQKIYDGLLKADRCRKLVIKWAKADGHVGANRDMSDGEDWYDNDEWELDEDLKKGQDVL